jgi:hypothetical protein
VGAARRPLMRIFPYSRAPLAPFSGWGHNVTRFDRGNDLADRIFYAAARDPTVKGSVKVNGYVPSKFLMRNGAYIADPVPGASQKAFLFSDSSGNNKTDGRIANPNNYLIVPCKP